MGKISWDFSLLLLLISLCMIIPKLTSSAPTFLYNYCSNSSSFAATDKNYPINLNATLHSLSSSSSASTTGYATASAGNGTTDAVYGFFLCRGDQTPSSCSNCVATAIRDQPKTVMCPRSKLGIIWYDECMVRYDNENIIGRMDQAPWLPMWNTRNITGNQTRFAELLGDTLTELVVQTASGGTAKKYATKAVSYTSFLTLYVLEQCTPDLSESDCSQCLTTAIGKILVRQGGRILTPSCSFRYEIYPFFNATTNVSSPPPLSPPSATTNITETGNDMIYE